MPASFHNARQAGGADGAGRRQQDGDSAAVRRDLRSPPEGRPDRESRCCASVFVRSFVFAFFSNKLGCLGSIAVSIVGTLVLLFLLRVL